MIQNIHGVLPHASDFSLGEHLSFRPRADVDRLHADLLGARHRAEYAGVLFLAADHLLRLDGDSCVEPRLTAADVEDVVVEDDVVDEKIVTVHDVAAPVAEAAHVGFERLNLLSVGVVEMQHSVGGVRVAHRMSVHHAGGGIREHPRQSEHEEKEHQCPVHRFQASHAL